MVRFDDKDEDEDEDDAECKPSKAKKTKLEVNEKTKCSLKIDRLAINDRSGTFRVDGAKYVRVEPSTKQISSVRITKYQEMTKKEGLLEEVATKKAENSKYIFNNKVRKNCFGSSTKL